MFDVAVVGLGAMGAMAAWRCASRGARVVGFERFTAAHSRGSSHGGSRIFRETVFEGVEYLPLVARAKPLWGELEKRSGATLFRRSGALYIGPRDGADVSGALSAGEGGGFEHHLLEFDELCARYPQHVPIDGDVAVFEPDAGLLDPVASILAALRLASEAGARLAFETPVLDVRSDGFGVIVTTASEAIHARRAIIATGAWYGDLTRTLQLPLRVQRSSALYFRAPVDGSFGIERFPAFIRKSGELDGWGVPDVDGSGVKIGAGSSAGKPWLTHADDNTGDLIDEDIAPTLAFARRAFPSWTPVLQSGLPCMNSKTPDLDFVIGTSERCPGLVLAGGFSGHGFKHAAGVGDIVADLALDGASDVALTRFSPDRFTAARR
ncbi:N-methyl-L-tryptophan oxidase [Mycolicibacterium arenosum]|uniref:N-methyl-L-tryptophan oxidase n=1 Tax=Mycolicibacterium arenosum TaxID=2952157 RepID=A0ABT1MER8_9MYCO|nr:N-methyl-L-tryptophan oxidase [Mycolicibacterium sp. CAU 1645]MCP9276902.1 N-methyl-L-tryptophan oxidase [Mycolicibacterium sp. CAU 1645]